LKFYRIGILNYRSISKADLKLGNITAVVGPSDVGKSNLVRAIRDWNNNVTGSGALSAGARTMRVAIVVDNNRIIWEKAQGFVEDKENPRYQANVPKSYKSTTRYCIEDSATGETVVLKRFGRKSPDQIKELSGIRPVRITEDESIILNISEQGDPWFMLSRPTWSKLTVARTIARACGIEDLMFAIKDCKSDVLENNREIKRLTKEVKKVEEKLNSDYFVNLDHLEETLDKTEKLYEKISLIDSRLESARSIFEQIADKERRLKRIDKAFEMLDPDSLTVDEEALAAWEIKQEAYSIIKKLSSNRKKLSEFDSSMKTDNEELEVLTSELEELIDKELICPLCGHPAHQECKDFLKRDQHA
jgi:uncharacterized protein YoxC